MKNKIEDAVAMLESLLVSLDHVQNLNWIANTKSWCQIEEGKKGSESNVEHITTAKEAISKAKTAEREIA